jgi:hypothetical protein
MWWKVTWAKVQINRAKGYVSLRGRMGALARNARDIDC